VDGTPGDKVHEFDLKGSGSVSVLDVYSKNAGTTAVYVVDSSNTLHVLDMDSKMIITKENVRHATFAEGLVLAVESEGSKLHILDAENPDKSLGVHDLGMEELKSVHYIDEKAIAVFHDECFDLHVFEFGEKATRAKIVEFKPTKNTSFSEAFEPSDNMLDESANYLCKPIRGSNFSFIGCSYAQSVDVLFKTEDNAWALISTEDNEIKVLAPTDAEGEMCSFKGVIYYELKFTPDESKTCKHKFTEEQIEIAYPRKIITLAYTGRVDVFEVYFKDLLESKDKAVRQRSAIESRRPQPASKVGDAKDLAPKGIGSVFGNMMLSDESKPAFLDHKPEMKDSGKGWFNKDPLEEAKKQRPDIENIKISKDRKQVSFSDKKSSSAHSDPMKASESQAKPILKSASNSGSPVKHSPEKKRISPEEQILILEQEEKEFLQNIEDNFTKIFLKTQYNIANDVNRSFQTLHNSVGQMDTVSAASISEADRYKQRLWAYVVGSDAQKRDMAKVSDSMHANFDTHDKIQNYWSVVKDSDDQSHHMTRDRLQNNDLFSKDIEETIRRGERALQDSSKFINIIRSLTKQARSLNENFIKARHVKIQGALDDPFLKKYNNSGVMQRLAQHNSGDQKWRTVERVLRGQDSDNIDASQKLRIYNTFIDELIENDGYLLKVLDKNHARLLAKIKDYEMFNESIEFDEPFQNLRSHHKYDFTEEVEGYGQNIPNQSASPNVSMPFASTSAGLGERQGLIEVDDPKAMQRKLQGQMKSAEVKTTNVNQIGSTKVPVVDVSESNKIIEQDDSDSDESPPPKNPKTERKPSAAPVAKGIMRAQSISKNNDMQRKIQDANKIGMLVQCDDSFDGSSSSSDSEDSDYTSGEKRQSNKISLQKLQTTIPEEMNLQLK
jgi:hypothetical protein